VRSPVLAPRIKAKETREGWLALYGQLDVAAFEAEFAGWTTLSLVRVPWVSDRVARNEADRYAREAGWTLRWGRDREGYRTGLAQLHHMSRLEAFAYKYSRATILMSVLVSLTLTSLFV
jgi:hypothetical protein